MEREEAKKYKNRAHAFEVLFVIGLLASLFFLPMAGLFGKHVSHVLVIVLMLSISFLAGAFSVKNDRLAKKYKPSDLESKKDNKKKDSSWNALLLTFNIIIAGIMIVSALEGGGSGGAAGIFIIPILLVVIVVSIGKSLRKKEK